MQGGFFSTKGAHALGMLVLLMLVIVLGSQASLNFERAKYSNPSPAIISVNGEGEVFAVPDIGQFSFSVTAEADTAPVAQEESGTKINAVLAYLSEQGIEDKDIKTDYYNLYPRYRYEERVCAANSYCPPGERVQDGFEVTQSISVKVRDTEKAPSIIAGVGERGATNISGLQFTIDDTDTLQAEARSKAITDAKEKAEILAAQLGVQLLRISSYTEGGNVPQPFYKTMAIADDFSEEAGFGGAELPAGEQSTMVNVTITYEVQ